MAYRLLGQYEAGGKYLNLSLNSHMVDNLSKRDRALLTALLYKTVEKKLTYDYYISAVAKRSVDKITPEALDAIRLGVCALLDMNSIPDHAAVNEAVRLIKRPSERSFVNGVLRGVAREKENLPLPDKSKNAPRYYSVYYSIPLPTVKYMISLLGEESAVGFFESVNSDSFTTSLTVNTERITVEDFIKKLTGAGYTAWKSEFSLVSVRVDGSLDPKEIDGFSDGEFFVQDEASALSSLILGAESGELIIDVCSAPGGKSFALALLSGDKADIRSFDIHDSKISLIESGAKRLGLSSVKASARDATLPDESLFGKADRVLCDVPCSGLGVFSKKPDLRYKDITALESLSALQLDILTASAKYLKAGGTLVYSTCTLRREENEDVVDKFLSENPDFEAVDFSISDISSENGRITLYPHVHKTDGFFISKLRKKK
ncbi:MAG: 16S rRNA (cytosine(967)-C(5))-methyltransferase RsmB [Clostridia bacterium]|nr:16S rRNA (cytosine(967)-C(5))-methyltransferase RsmB [Clostridia bacterium]